MLQCSRKFLFSKEDRKFMINELKKFVNGDSIFFFEVFIIWY